MLKSHNPYNVLSEIISFENVQQMGEMITLKLCVVVTLTLAKLWNGSTSDSLKMRYSP